MMSFRLSKKDRGEALSFAACESGRPAVFSEDILASLVARRAVPRRAGAAAKRTAD
jgi:hypothetical protein